LPLLGSNQDSPDPESSRPGKHCGQPVGIRPLPEHRCPLSCRSLPARARRNYGKTTAPSAVAHHAGTSQIPLGEHRAPATSAAGSAAEHQSLRKDHGATRRQQPAGGVAQPLPCGPADRRGPLLRRHRLLVLRLQCAADRRRHPPQLDDGLRPSLDQRADTGDLM
jgi:hypothetical protein